MIYQYVKIKIVQEVQYSYACDASDYGGSSVSYLSSYSGKVSR